MASLFVPRKMRLSFDLKRYPPQSTFVCPYLLLLVACGGAHSGHSCPEWAGRQVEEVSYPFEFPEFATAVQRAAGDRSAHFTYSLEVASYRMMVSHRIPLNDRSIARAVRYVMRAREIAGPRVLFGNRTRIINILHEYDTYDRLFAAGTVIRKELGLGAQAQDIWTFQGPTEIDRALKAIANSRGPTTVYIYAHAMGETIRLSDTESLQLDDLARALKQRGTSWVNIIADECDGVVTYLPAALQRLDVEIPSYIVSATARGDMTRGSRLLNAISGTGKNTGTYFLDPSKPEFEDLAQSQDFVLVWTPTQSQRHQLQAVWPFPTKRIDAQDAAIYPAWVWELANHSLPCLFPANFS